MNFCYTINSSPAATWSSLSPSENRRITGCLRLAGTSVSIYPNSTHSEPEQSAQGNGLAASQDLSGGDSTNSLGNLCQCSVTRTAQKFFHMFRRNLLFSPKLNSLISHFPPPFLIEEVLGSAHHESHHVYPSSCT